jgi:thiol-disulfide isomerase/thioredoxin
VRKHWVLALLSAVGLLAAAAAILIALNPAPTVPAISASDAASRQPYVIKLHARWCVICMTTKGDWAAVQEAYAGKVRFVVFDFTSDATTEASRIEAGRLGLGTVFEEYGGETGTVLVLDGVSKEVRHSLHGHRQAADYRAAIDTTLAALR